MFTKPDFRPVFTPGRLPASSFLAVTGLLLLALLAGPPVVVAQDEVVSPEAIEEQIEALEDQIEVQREALNDQIEAQRDELDEQIEEQREALDEQLETPEEVGYEVEVRTHRAKRHRIHKDTQVVFGRSAHVEENETVQDVVAIGGSVFLNGEVQGDAVAVGGSAHVEGLVSGDVVAVGGTVHVGSNAEIMGEAVSVGGTVEYEDGAQIHGQVTEVPLGEGIHIGIPHIGLGGLGSDWGDHEPFFHLFGFVWSLVGLALLFLFAALILMLFRTPVERVAYRAATDPWKSGFVGLLSQILFVPVLVITILVLCISIIGIPLLILLPFVMLGLCLMALLGYTAVAYRIGRWAETRFGWKVDSPYVALMIGVLAVQIWCLAGDLLDVAGGFLWFFSVMFGLVGFLASYLTWTVGFGAALMTRVGTDGPTGAGESEAMLPPAPPAPPTASAAVSPGGVAGTATVAIDEMPLAPAPEAQPEVPLSEMPEREDLSLGWEPEPAPTDEALSEEVPEGDAASDGEGGEEADSERRETD